MSPEELAARLAEVEDQNAQLLGCLEELAGVVRSLQHQVATHLGITPALAEVPAGDLAGEVEQYLRERAEGWEVG